MKKQTNLNHAFETVRMDKFSQTEYREIAL